MRKLLVGLALLSVFSASATGRLTENEIDKALAKARLSTDLWFCNNEKALEEVADSLNIQNNLGCVNAIKEAKLSLEVEEILAILEQHAVRLEHLKDFEAKVKSGVGYIDLVPSVKKLKANGISLNLVERNTSLNFEQMLVVRLSFERSKTKLERALEKI